MTKGYEVSFLGNENDLELIKVIYNPMNILKVENVHYK